MILDIPKPEEFEFNGISCLDDAWEIALDFILNLEEFLDYDNETDDERVEKFWHSTRLKLARAHVTLQQGAEFLVKSRIVRISPYLLLFNNPSLLPKNCNKKDLYYADFRTVDAQDLIKIHDTFAENKFDSTFKTEFENLRRLRNAISHTIDKRSKIDAEHIVTKVLYIHSYFFPNFSWLSERNRSLCNGPYAELYSSDYAEPQTIREFNKIFHLLKPAALKKYFNIDKRQKWYICPACNHQTSDWEIYPKTAQLSTNTNNAKQIICHVCNLKQDVIRDTCPQNDCNNNVLSYEYDICLKCANSLK